MNGDFAALSYQLVQPLSHHSALTISIGIGTMTSAGASAPSSFFNLRMRSVPASCPALQAPKASSRGSMYAMG